MACSNAWGPSWARCWMAVFKLRKGSGLSCSPLPAKQGCRQVSVLEKWAGHAAEERRAFSAAAFIAWFAGDELQVGRMLLARLGRGFAFSGKRAKKTVFPTTVLTCMQQNLASGGCNLCMSLETLLLGDCFLFSLFFFLILYSRCHIILS